MSCAGCREKSEDVFSLQGQVYAAYGRVFIALSTGWGWQVDKIAPDRFDLIGASIALVGVCIIMYLPRP